MRRTAELSRFYRRGDETYVVYHGGRIVGYRREGNDCWMAWRSQTGKWDKAGPKQARAFGQASFRGEIEH